jgi:hypothetical protein
VPSDTATKKTINNSQLERTSPQKQNRKERTRSQEEKKIGNENNSGMYDPFF